eukprot:4161240-Pleurochrysis_carterae.AAC.1
MAFVPKCASFPWDLCQNVQPFMACVPKSARIHGMCARMCKLSRDLCRKSAIFDGTCAKKGKISQHLCQNVPTFMALMSKRASHLSSPSLPFNVRVACVRPHLRNAEAAGDQVVTDACGKADGDGGGGSDGSGRRRNRHRLGQGGGAAGGHRGGRCGGVHRVGSRGAAGGAGGAGGRGVGGRGGGVGAHRRACRCSGRGEASKQEGWPDVGDDAANTC